MSHANNFSLKSGQKALTNCNDTLKKVASTCCMADRSSMMNQSLLMLDELDTDFNNTTTNQTSLKDYQTKIEILGSLIGKLYVSCCTDTREPLYQNIFRQLNIAHADISKAMGLSH